MTRATVDSDHLSLRLDRKAKAALADDAERAGLTVAGFILALHREHRVRVLRKRRSLDTGARRKR